MDTIHFRRHLHRHPELSFEEHRTAAFIAEVLTEAGIHFEPIARTGILARIEGSKTTPETARRALILRADIDALPIEEQTALPYASENRGVMHACGHDMHAAALYGTLCALQQNPDFAGVVFGLFQPGEELNPGGASLVLAEEPFADYEVIACIGEHVDWQLEVGQIGLHAGPFMASSDELRFRVGGKGGHGAMRHLITDPVAATATLITSLLALNEEGVTLSVGKIAAEGATNVIPDEVYLEGTLRTFDEQRRQVLHRTIEELIAKNDTLHGTTTQLDLSHGYPAVCNDAALTELARTLATSLGFAPCDLERRMTAEDFGFYTLRYPSLFYRLGVGKASGRSHTPHFAPDESALAVGEKLFTTLVYTLLNDEER
ncbi:MAG: M20 family metallopeptidase [Rikenellaceae bacterium]|nr:M20 family metallopeptidase [Rikenellaceae bacterium]